MFQLEGRVLPVIAASAGFVKAHLPCLIRDQAGGNKGYFTFVQFVGCGASASGQEDCMPVDHVIGMLARGEWTAVQRRPILQQLNPGPGCRCVTRWRLVSAGRGVQGRQYGKIRLL